MMAQALLTSEVLQGDELKEMLGDLARVPAPVAEAIGRDQALALAFTRRA
jgi:hypothetical protein